MMFLVSISSASYELSLSSQKIKGVTDITFVKEAAFIGKTTRPTDEVDLGSHCNHHDNKIWFDTTL